MAGSSRLTGIMIAMLFAGCSTTAHTAKPKIPTVATLRDDSACLRDTGSRLPYSGTTCSANGRSYSNDDIMRTGATSAGTALRLLDPRITVNR